MRVQGAGVGDAQGWRGPGLPCSVRVALHAHGQLQRPDRALHANPEARTSRWHSGPEFVCQCRLHTLSGRFHMPCREQLNNYAPTTEARAPWSPHSATREAAVRSPHVRMKSSPCSPQLEKSTHS